jgi:hypothetical protein
LAIVIDFVVGAGPLIVQHSRCEFLLSRALVLTTPPTVTCLAAGLQCHTFFENFGTNDVVLIWFHSETLGGGGNVDDKIP